jgi:hypothetical protein
MTTNKYFVLTNSNDTLSKRFHVLFEGYNPTMEKSQTVDRTLDGGLDVSMGGLYEQHEYLVRVRHTEEEDEYEESDWGTLEDLKTFFSYNNPNGTPSNILVLTTHFGDDYDVLMVGSFAEKILGIEIEGIYSFYVIQCTFLFIGPTEESS